MLETDGREFEILVGSNDVLCVVVFVRLGDEEVRKEA